MCSNEELTIILKGKEAENYLYVTKKVHDLKILSDRIDESLTRVKIKLENIKEETTNVTPN